MRGQPTSRREMGSWRLFSNISLLMTYLKMWPVPNRKDGARELMLLQ